VGFWGFLGLGKARHPRTERREDTVALSSLDAHGRASPGKRDGGPAWHPRPRPSQGEVILGNWGLPRNHVLVSFPRPPPHRTSWVAGAVSVGSGLTRDARIEGSRLHESLSFLPKLLLVMAAVVWELLLLACRQEPNPTAVKTEQETGATSLLQGSTWARLSSKRASLRDRGRSPHQERPRPVSAIDPRSSHPLLCSRWRSFVAVSHSAQQTPAKLL
jgi:hypothetical protein